MQILDINFPLFLPFFLTFHLLVPLVIGRQLVTANWTRASLFQPWENAILVETVLAWELVYHVVLFQRF